MMKFFWGLLLARGVLFPRLLFFTRTLGVFHRRPTVRIGLLGEARRRLGRSWVSPRLHLLRSEVFARILGPPSKVEGLVSHCLHVRRAAAHTCGVWNSVARTDAMASERPGLRGNRMSGAPWSPVDVHAGRDAWPGQRGLGRVALASLLPCPPARRGAFARGLGHEAPENSAPSPLAARTPPCWSERAVPDRNVTSSSSRRVDGVRHVVELASRRWR